MLDFVSTPVTQMSIEELVVPPGAADGITAAAMRRSGATLLAVQSKDGGISVGPRDDAVLQQGDIVVAMGTLEHLEALAGVLRPVEPAR